ncbi:NAD(P)/FAD-dependent oxidoreductase [Denitrobaculum tricleocarpae]|uniref:FAD-binding oxidoreductase n=1 Tax=Denitrobaculum tricleocarpae TaxID=2591009 RepID=A0A545U2Y8_9PROT|nr:FAD-binding oxidoreductase [Denitrobaculum tricleocarpae]TQV83847.1 FAD-binding oxidoreductase [Denitrobaculum tricleocarpae]
MSGASTHSAAAARKVAVIGAGIIGVSTAVWLQRSGCEVTLIDRLGPGEGTSYGNGGILASCSVVPVTVPGLLRKVPSMLMDPNSPLFLRWSYLPKLLPFLRHYLSHCSAEETTRIASALSAVIGDSLEQHQALAKGTGAEKWLVPSDYLFLYDDRSKFEADSFGWGLRKANGFSWQELDADAFKAYDPVFSQDLKFAACLSGHGRIADPGRYVKDLADWVVKNGGRSVKADVTDFRKEDGAVSGVVTDQGVIECDSAVVTAGVWSGPLTKKLGMNVPLESERGYHVELIEPSVMPRSPVMVASGKYVVTPMDGRLRVAGLVEFGGLDAPASRRPIELLLENISKAIPNLTWKETREWMGHRPAVSDSIPVIGEAPGLKSVFMGFGHHHIGLTGGPKTGRVLAGLISGDRPNIDLSAYAPARFA